MRFVNTLATLLFLTFSLFAQNNDLVTRIIDVGAGLCTVTKIPTNSGDKYFVFDAGGEFNFEAKLCVNGIKSFIGGETIDLMVISHSDADHLADADDVLNSFSVKRVVHSGAERDTEQWRNLMKAINDEVGIDDWNLAQKPLRPGEQIKIGPATLTLVAGWQKWIPPDLFDTGEFNNVMSLVVRLEFEGKSILFTGDTIGRRKSDRDDVCKNAEEFMVANSAAITLRSNVLIAPHHGGNNGSSACFIEAVFGGVGNRVSPRYVIFPAGHAHGHPTKGVVNRFKKLANLTDEFMFRTDRGDDEGSGHHYDDPTGKDGCVDRPGDDSIEVKMAVDGSMSVRYVNPIGGSC